MSKLKPKSQAFEELIAKAPVNSLQELLNYILQFYNFKSEPEKNFDPILQHHFAHLSLASAKIRQVLLAELNMVEKKEPFKCDFIDFELNQDKGEIAFFKHTVDVSTQLVSSTEPVPVGSYPELTVGPFVLDHLALAAFLDEKFKNKALKKYFTIKQTSDHLEFVITVKLLQKNINQSCELNFFGKLLLASKNLTVTVKFEGFVSTEDNGPAALFNNVSGNKVLHKKVLDSSIQGALENQSILVELSFIMERYLYAIKGMFGEADKIFEMIRLIAPLTKEGSVWDQSRALKNQLLDDIKNAKKGK